MKKLIISFLLFSSTVLSNDTALEKIRLQIKDIQKNKKKYKKKNKAKIYIKPDFRTVAISSLVKRYRLKKSELLSFINDTNYLKEHLTIEPYKTKKNLNKYYFNNYARIIFLMIITDLCEYMTIKNKMIEDANRIFFGLSKEYKEKLLQDKDKLNKDKYEYSLKNISLWEF